MPKIDLGRKMYNLRGAALRGEGGEHLTVGMACEIALSRANDTNEIVEKVKRCKMAMMIIKAGTGSISVTSEDVTKIKHCAGHCLPTDVAGTLALILEDELDDDTSAETETEPEKVAE